MIRGDLDSTTKQVQSRVVWFSLVSFVIVVYTGAETTLDRIGSNLSTSVNGL